jgi:hypothetical protein
MKGSKLIYKVLIGLGSLSALIMSALNFYPSWSQHARTLHEPLFIATILSFGFASLLRGLTHKRKEEVIGWIGGMELRLRVFNILAAIAFAGILITPVTYPEGHGVQPYIYFCHYLFTILAIIFHQLQMMADSRWQIKWVAAGLTSILLFILGVTTDLYSISWGEIAVAIPPIYYTLKTNDLAE